MWSCVIQDFPHTSWVHTKDPPVFDPPSVHSFSATAPALEWTSLAFSSKAFCAYSSGSIIATTYPPNSATNPVTRSDIYQVEMNARCWYGCKDCASANLPSSTPREISMGVLSDGTFTVKHPWVSQYLDALARAYYEAIMKNEKDRPTYYWSPQPKTIQRLGSVEGVSGLLEMELDKTQSARILALAALRVFENPRHPAHFALWGRPTDKRSAQVVYEMIRECHLSLRSSPLSSSQSQTTRYHSLPPQRIGWGTNKCCTTFIVNKHSSSRCKIGHIQKTMMKRTGSRRARRWLKPPPSGPPFPAAFGASSKPAAPQSLEFRSLLMESCMPPLQRYQQWLEMMKRTL